MFPLSRRCRNTLIRVLRSRIFAPDKEFCRLRAAAKGVSAGRSSLNVRQEIYMAIQIVWRRRNEVFRRGTGGSGISRHRSINGAETSESACGPLRVSESASQRVSESASQRVRRACGSLAASVAGLSRLALRCMSAVSPSSSCFQACRAACSLRTMRSNAAQTSAMRPEISRHSGCLRGSR